MAVPTTTTSLRSQIVGAWELREYCAYLPNDPSNKKYPQGPNAKGIIMYTLDGYMSAQLETPGQSPFNVAEATDSDWATAGKSYVAYTGRFFLDERGDEKGRPILKHEMFTSSLPYLRGDTQRRVCKIQDEEDGRYLILSLDATVKVGGEDRLILVRWRRLPNNQATEPGQDAGKLYAGNKL